MSDRVRIDLPGVQRVTAPVEDTVRKVEEALRRLAEIRSTCDGSWGSDELGAEFAKNYVPAVEEQVGSGTAASEALGRYPVETRDTAERLHRVDAENAQSVRHDEP
ncbi:hypothetical protein HX744_26785 [Pseudonocardia sp. ICBG1122]|nr:hypothetical protein [Pseudonocardia pini]